jgi:hypothetical protein
MLAVASDYFVPQLSANSDKKNPLAKQGILYCFITCEYSTRLRSFVAAQSG